MSAPYKEQRQNYPVTHSEGANRIMVVAFFFFFLILEVNTILAVVSVIVHNGFLAAQVPTFSTRLSSFLKGVSGF